MKIRSLSILTLACLLIFASCKTQKKKGDLGPVSQLYHNTTAEFNGYFNADVILTESIINLENSYQDNYNKILPVFKYTAAENPRALAGPLDQAIEKVTVVVSLHPESHWTDDCYLLMGQAQYLKQDFEAAEETFEYLLAEFNPATVASKKASSKAGKKKKGKKKSSPKSKSSKKKKKVPTAKKKKKKKKKKKRKPTSNRKKKKRKKTKRNPNPTRPRTTDTENPDEETAVINDQEEEEADAEASEEIGMISLGINQGNFDDVGSAENYGLRHRPAHQEGMLWLARTYMERNDFPAAERIMGQLSRSPNTFEDVRKDLAAVQADYFLKRKSYDNAIEQLNLAIDLEKDNLKKARYSFIIAQLHEKSGRIAEAYEAYAQVAKFKPDYEMAFSAELNTIRSSWANGLQSADDAQKTLEKMTKDIKNVDYLDAIYFTMANINLKDGNKDLAIANLRKSLDSSQGKSAQKGDSYLLLGDLYFEANDFVLAKSYYDSTITILPKSDDDYMRVKLLAENLTDIAENLEVIKLQDSLLQIATMSEDEMRAFAFDIRQKEIEARREALLNSKKVEGPTSRIDPRRAAPGPSATGESTFFAYNDRVLKRGSRDFERDWNERPLVDNWRRSAAISNTDVVEQQEELELAAAVITDEDIDKVLSDVPRNDADIRLAERKVEAALFALGRLYRDRLENNERSIESLNSLLTRFPETDQRVEAWYYLYLAFMDEGDQAKAKKYYDLIVANAPNSTFGLILTDPDYASKALDEESRLNQAYDQVYATFTAGKYEEADQMIRAAKNEFGSNNALQARFALLEAMLVGNKEGKEAYITALKDVIARFPDRPESTRAKEILRLLGAAVASGPGRTEVNPSDLTAGDSPFEIEENPTAMHYVIIVFEGKIDLASAKVKVSDFNKQFYNVDRLKVANMYLGDAENRIPVIVVRRFNGGEKAMEFYNTVGQNADQFLGSDFQYKVYPISQTNYRHVLRSKSVDGYDAFFFANYLN